MNLGSSKILGGIGALLMFIGIFLFSTITALVIVELVGAILILVGLHGLGTHYQDSGIFKKALYGVIIAIVGAVIAAVIGLTIILANITPLLYQMYPGWDGNWASLSGMTPDTSAFTAGNFDLSTFMPFFIGLIAVLVIMWIVAIIASFFIRSSLKSVSAKSNVGLFGTAGLLMLIGAFLTIIIIGLVLIWIAALLLAIAFFQIKQSEPTVATAPAAQYPPPPPTTA
jgi:uncharacterized membrane protein